LEKIVLLKMWKSKREWISYRVLKKKKKGEKRKLKPCREIFEAHVDFFGVFVIKPWL
jgi:hypothetical protein